MTIPIGTRLGHYEIRSPLGEGGMGEVYLARDSGLDRDVAIKVLRGNGDDTPDRARRFVQEAKAASSFNHPNVAHIYEIGTEDALRFIVMEVVPGETLRRMVSKGPMPMEDILSIGTQVASALAAAHAVGIVHRDIKPENVIVRPDGYAKVLDFGLAKVAPTPRAPDAETQVRTASGVVVGTLRYMSPEQLAGGEVSAASDVFSLGVVLYEMVAGRRPFTGETPTEIATAVLSAAPPALIELRADTPPRLAAVIHRALSKNVTDRFRDAGELLEELRQISRAGSMATVTMPTTAMQSRSTPRVLTGAAAVLLAALIAAGFFAVRRSRQNDAARAALSRAEQLVAERRYADAFDAALPAAAVLPGDPRLTALMARTSSRVVFESVPPGATVRLERLGAAGPASIAGTTPLTIERLARADYVVTFEKKGFAPALRPLPLAPQFVRDFESPDRPDGLRVRLVEASRVPAGMVFVEGGPARLSGWSRPSDRVVELRDFFIDRHEVSNRRFLEFVNDGGYRRRELWEHPFELDGKSLSFDEAMARFRDTTGLPGPRQWSGGAPPAGKEDHPVTGVTWYEAAAFARWRGASLPTAFQWEEAARPAMRGSVGIALPWGVVMEGVDVTERTNFRGRGTMPVDSLPFGLSPWGALHMAGNVAEWCRNPMPPGYAVRGGGWDDAVYTFGRTGTRPPFFTSPATGFRCAKEAEPTGEDGDFALNAKATIPEYRPVDDRAFGEIRARYDYARTPMRSRVVETVDTGSWRREKIEFQSGETTVPAYLYLPRGFTPPAQVIFFSPAGDVVRGNRALPDSIESSLSPFIRGGRAVFSIVMEGFLGRPRRSGTAEPDSRTPDYVDYVVNEVTELRRGLDYLATRKDLDVSRVAFVAPSAGASSGVILAALEDRFRSVLLIGTHIHPIEMGDTPAANRIHFAPRIRAPKMMLQGRYDESALLETQAMPLFRLLTEPKRLVVYEGSHVPPMDVAVPIITKWLDETLGPVR